MQRTHWPHEGSLVFAGGGGVPKHGGNIKGTFEGQRRGVRFTGVYAVVDAIVNENGNNLVSKVKKNYTVHSNP